jgi:dolichyl-diphosphooligosaccharide--protein glycosyltransferase
MEENTPAPGQYNNPDGEKIEYLGTYDRTGDYDYPDGAYGVLSWWDYGHWITNRAERIPNANPFQQGATSAAEFLLAQNEEEALSTLEEEFDESETAETEYVMIDWQMAET